MVLFPGLFEEYIAIIVSSYLGRRTPAFDLLLLEMRDFIS